MRNHNVMVSICCLTYNHEKYIADALESFLMQKTNFDFEIIIHDDASTDNTAGILREYEKKYPGIIKVVYEDENQYSKTKKLNLQSYFALISGKYIALCEGDDYWIDNYKLQMQVDYMEKHPTCTLCFHAADVVDEDKNIIREQLPYATSRECSVEDVICKIINYPTASLFFPSKLVRELPEFYYECPVGDVPLQLFLTSRGYAYYMNKRMSAYRTGLENSWNNQTYNRKEKLLEHTKNMIRMYSKFNEYTDNKYESAIKEAVNRRLIVCFLTSSNKKEKNKYLKLLPAKIRIKLIVKTRFPKITELVRKSKSLL